MNEKAMNERQTINEKTILQAEGYDKIDGRNAYQSKVKKLTLGQPVQEENASMRIAAQLWRENSAGQLEMDTELAIHQVLDIAIFAVRGLLHFRDAYRLPLLYDPEKPVLERIGIQGGVMPVAVCTENPTLDTDIQAFERAVGDLGELTGERLRVLSRILEEMEY